METRGSRRISDRYFEDFFRTFGRTDSLYIVEGGKTVSEELKDHYDKVYRYCYFKVHNRYVAGECTCMQGGRIIR